MSKKAGLIGKVNTVVSMGVEYSENGVSEKLVQDVASELVTMGTGPAAPATEIVLEDGKSDNGVTNTSNMSNNFEQTGRQRNGYIYRNFTMRNQRSVDTRPASVRNKAAAEKAKGNPIAQFWLKVLPARD